MDPCRFNRLVRRRTGSRRNVGSAFEAVAYLAGGEWPQPRGPKYGKALRACYECLDGMLEPEPARAGSKSR